MSAIVQALLMSTGADALASPLLVLHMDGSDGSTTFTDSSSYARTVTAGGNAQLDTGVAPKFGSASGIFDGTGDYLSVAASSQLQPGARDFTLHGWIRPSNVNGGNYNIFTMRADNTSFAPFLLRRSGNVLSLQHSTSGADWAAITTGGTLTANTQHHVALVKYGSSLKVYLNGSSAISQTVSGALYDNGAPLIIGGDTNVNFWIGHIDEVIYETGARWTANFTPPDAPFPDS